LTPSTGRGRLGVRGACPVEAEHPAEVAVQGGDDDQGVALPRCQHPPQRPEGDVGPPAVDGVGQLPRRDGAGLPEERPEVLGTDLGPLPVGGRHRREQVLEATEVLPEVLVEQGGGAPSRRTGAPARWDRSQTSRPLALWGALASTTRPTSFTALVRAVMTARSPPRPAVLPPLAPGEPP
jgi:hypothetical protein